MFKFEYIEYFYWGIVFFFTVLALSVLFFERRKKLLSAAGEKALKYFRLVPASLWWAKAYSVAFGVFFIATAAANPKWGNKEVQLIGDKADIFIAFDISNSMMTEDIKPSRLTRAQKWTSDLVESLKSNRIGLIYFAGEAHLQVPLTSDYAAVQFALKGAHPNLAGTQGTNISETISAAEQSFVDGFDEKKVLILVTDGEEHEEKAFRIAKKAQENNLVLITVGVGTERGGFVPYTFRGKESYKKDMSGKYVVSKLNTEMLNQLADAGGGSSYMVTQGQNAIDDIKEKILRYQKKSNTKEIFNEKRSYYPLCLIIGMICMLFAWITPIDNKYIRFKVVIFVLFSATTISAQDDHKLLLEGEYLYKKSDFKGAMKKYGAVTGSDKATYNLGNSMYMSGDYPAAEEAFDISSNTANVDIKFRSFYNKGNAQFQQRKWDQAIASYKKALRLNPESKKAKENLTQAILNKQEDKRKEQQNKQNQNSQNQNQQGQNQQDQNQQGQNQDKQNDENNSSNSDNQSDKESENGQNNDEDQKNGQEDYSDENKQEPNKQGQAKRKPSSVSKQQALELLRMTENEEERVLRNMYRPKKSTKVKDW